MPYNFNQATVPYGVNEPCDEADWSHDDSNLAPPDVDDHPLSQPAAPRRLTVPGNFNQTNLPSGANEPYEETEWSHDGSNLILDLDDPMLSQGAANVDSIDPLLLMQGSLEPPGIPTQQAHTIDQSQSQQLSYESVVQGVQDCIDAGALSAGHQNALQNTILFLQHQNETRQQLQETLLMVQHRLDRETPFPVNVTAPSPATISGSVPRLEQTWPVSHSTTSSYLMVNAPEQAIAGNQHGTRLSRSTSRSSIRSWPIHVRHASEAEVMRIRHHLRQKRFNGCSRQNANSEPDGRLRCLYGCGAAWSLQHWGQWRRHHWPLEPGLLWLCPSCPRVCSRHVHLVDHLRGSHQEDPAQGRLHAHAAVKQLQIPRHCGFCHAAAGSINSFDGYFRHVYGHFSDGANFSEWTDYDGRQTFSRRTSLIGNRTLELPRDWPDDEDEYQGGFNGNQAQYSSLSSATPAPQGNQRTHVSYAAAVANGPYRSSAATKTGSERPVRKADERAIPQSRCRGPEVVRSNAQCKEKMKSRPGAGKVAPIEHDMKPVMKRLSELRFPRGSHKEEETECSPHDDLIDPIRPHSDGDRISRKLSGAGRVRESQEGSTEEQQYDMLRDLVHSGSLSYILSLMLPRRLHWRRAARHPHSGVEAAHSQPTSPQNPMGLTGLVL